MITTLQDPVAPEEHLMHKLVALATKKDEKFKTFTAPLTTLFRALGLACPATFRVRARMTAELGSEIRSVKILLSHKKALKALLRFIGRTGRFGDDYGTMELPAAEE